MSFVDLILLSVYVLEFLLGLYVLFNNAKRTVNRALALFTFSVAGWGGSVLLAKYTETVFAGRLAFASGTILILSYVFFAAVFPNREKLNPGYYLALVPAAFFFALSFFSDLLVQSFSVVGGSIVAERGMLYPFFVGYAIVYIAFSVVVLIRSYSRSVGIQKLQLNYFFFGLFAFMVGAVLSNILLPAVGVQDFNTIGPGFSIFFIAATAYSILRFRLMDVRFVFRRSFVYLAALITLVVIMVFASAIQQQFFPNFLTSWMRGALAIILSIVVFEPIRSTYMTIANKYFFTGLSNYQDATRDFIRRLTTLIEIDQIVDLAEDVIVNVMKADSFAFVLRDPTKKREGFVVSRLVGLNEKDVKELIRDRKFVDQVKKITELFSVDKALESENTKTAFSKTFLKKAKKHGVRVVVPFLKGEKLNGFILLGHKASKDAYTVLDFDFLTTMSNQAAIAIENALLYQEIQDYSENLEQRVEEQTSEIKELYEMKSNFLTVASHQLRTPTSIIRGMLSMLVEESIPPEKKDEMIEAAFKSSSSLERVIDDILTAAEIDSARFDFDPEAVDIIPIVERIVEDLQLKAEKKHLKLEFVKPRFKEALALTNKSKIEQAFVNLIDNALNYTAEGGVTVRIQKEKYRGSERIAFLCTDTGVGMTKTDMNKIGEKFFRSKNVFSVHPNGTGLGIYIVKQVVKASKGKLVLESDGLGKGSTFKIVLKTPKKRNDE